MADGGHDDDRVDDVGGPGGGAGDAGGTAGGLVVGEDVAATVTAMLQAGTVDVVDAIVIVTAVRHRAPIVTSDPGDLTRIADSIGVKIRLFPT
ncbi:MAG: hypothetical protein ACRDPD_10435 [Streptosporangiaceae bacterium]